MSTDNVVQFRPADQPQAANDAAPSPSARPRPPVAPIAKKVGGFALRGLTILAFAGLMAIRLAAFFILSVVRIFLRPVLSVFGAVLLIAACAIFFGYEAGAAEKTRLLVGALLGSLGCITLRFYYDELLAWLSPSRQQLSA